MPHSPHWKPANSYDIIRQANLGPWEIDNTDRESCRLVGQMRIWDIGGFRIGLSYGQREPAIQLAAEIRLFPNLGAIRENGSHPGKNSPILSQASHQVFGVT